MYHVLAAYEKYRGPLGNVRKGVLVCLWLVSLISIRAPLRLIFFLHKNLCALSSFNCIYLDETGFHGIWHYHSSFTDEFGSSWNSLCGSGAGCENHLNMMI